MLKSKLHSTDDFLDDLQGGRPEQLQEKILYLTVSKLFGELNLSCSKLTSKFLKVFEKNLKEYQNL